MSANPLTILLFASSLTLIACNEETKESDGTTGADTQATGGSTSGDVTTTTASGSTSSSSTAGTGGDATTTTAGTGGDATTTETGGDATTTAGTTGGGSLPASCEAYCANFVDCFDFGPEDLDDCLEECSSGWGYAGIDAICEAALIDLNYCYADASCRQLEGPDPCVIEDAAAEIACGGADQCLYYGRGDAEYCWIDQECPGTYLSLECEEDLCTCYDFDLGPVGTCANDVCVDGVDADALLQKAVECCGWQP